MAANSEVLLGDVLQCGICTEAFQVSGRMKPKMLPCQHSFCQQCLDSMSTGMRIQCPVCRRNHATSVDELPFNLTLLQIIDQNGPAAPDPDGEARKQTSASNGCIANIQRLHESPEEAKEIVKLYEELQQNTDFDPDRFSNLLKCMEHYEQVGDAEHLGIITDVMQIAYNLLQKARSQFLFHEELNDRLIKEVIAVMKTFEQHRTIQERGVNIFTLLASPSILGNQLLNVEKVIFQSLNVLTEEDFEFKVVEMTSILTRDVPKEIRAVLGSENNVKSLLRILRLKLHSHSYKPTFYAIVTTFISLSDETATACINIVKEKGLDLFDKLLQDERVTDSIKGDALIAVSNFAEVPEVQKEMIKHRSLVETLKNLMMSENLWISFISASSIAHLSLVSRREWTQLCGASNFCEDLLQKLYRKVSSWELTISTPILYDSFEPFYHLLRRYDSPPAQIFAAWTIRHLCHINKNKYQEMLVREGALNLLIDIKENSYADLNVREIVGDILASIDC